MASRRLLSIGTDRLLFKEGSAVRARQIEYAKNYDEVHIIVFSGTEFSEQSIGPHCWVYPTRSKVRIMRPLDAIRLGRFICKKRGITEITCQDSALTAMAGLSLKKEFNIPVELQIHEDIGSPHYTTVLMHRIRKSLSMSYLPKADHVRVVSERIKKFLTDSHLVDGAKIEVRPIAVDTENIRLTPVTESDDLHKKYPQFSTIVLVASRLEKEKNVVLAIKAWPEVLKKIPGAGLVIVGNGSQKKVLEDLASNFIGTSIMFEEWADQTRLISYYKTADIFLNTSLFEGYGMALVEASAAGCTVVSTDVGVAREIGAHIVDWKADAVAQKITEVL